MNTRYYISFDGGSNYTEFFPTNSPKFSLEQENGECFFRWKVDSFRIGATKNPSVYATLSSWFTDTTKFLTDIKYWVQSDIATHEFIGPISSGRLDDQNSIYECTPDPDDKYRDILLKYNTVWQNRLVSYLFYLNSSFFIPVLSTTYFTNSTFQSFSDPTHHVSYTHSGAYSGPEYGSNDIIDAPDGGTVIVIVKNLTYTGDAPKLVLAASAGGTEYSNKVTISVDGVYKLVMSGTHTSVLSLSMLNLTGISKSGSFDYIIYYPVLKQSGDTLKNVLNAIINGYYYMNLSYTIKSTILWQDSLGSDPPSAIDSFMIAHPGEDYVIEGTTVFNNLWLTRADTFTTNKESSIDLCLKDITTMLQKLRLWWFIDEDDNFRIEHEKYLRSYDSQLDVTALFKPEVDAKIYNYDLSNAFNQVNYSEQNQSDEDWVAYPVMFPAQVTSTQINDINFNNLSTDMSYIIANPDKASSSGLVLMYLDSNNMLQYDASVLTPANSYFNTKLGWAWLCANYYNYFAESKTGTINNSVAITYNAVKEYLKQYGIKFYYADDIDWKKPFTLSYGTGWLTGATYDPETGFYTINVGYDPYA